MTEKLYDKLITHQNSYLYIDENIKPTLSVTFVIPVFNSSASIKQTVDSIENQLHRELIKEVILVNDGSTDDSLALLNSIAATSELQIKVLDNGERKYAAYARNRGIERATGDLICFIDSDIVLPKDYVVKNVCWHELNNCITFALRSNISDFAEVKFPANTAEGDFREKLISKYGDLQDAPMKFSDTHTLPELCLTCAVTYRRADLVYVKGCPENFVGWGFNDTAMAAKVISLGRSVIPVLDATVFHLEHAPRSGRTAKKWAEFALNKQRYQKMLQLPTDMTFQYNIEALDY